jgi:hypothetical protein
MPTGRFREAEFHWPLSGDEFEERTDATRPNSAALALRAGVCNSAVNSRSAQMKAPLATRNGCLGQEGMGTTILARFFAQRACQCRLSRRHYVRPRCLRYGEKNIRTALKSASIGTLGCV